MHVHEEMGCERSLTERASPNNILVRFLERSRMSGNGGVHLKPVPGMSGVPIAHSWSSRFLNLALAGSASGGAQSANAKVADRAVEELGARRRHERPSLINISSAPVVTHL